MSSSKLQTALSLKADRWIKKDRRSLQQEEAEKMLTRLYWATDNLKNESQGFTVYTEVNE